MSDISSDGGWRVTKSVTNPWGIIPITADGQALSPAATAYMERLKAQIRRPDTPAKRHHYVAQSHLKKWSDDGKRVWVLDTQTGSKRLLGVRDICVSENFYKVRGKDGIPHNRIELLFGVIDQEMSRVSRVLESTTNPESLSFEDFMATGMLVAVQRMRTLQQRRLIEQNNAWLVAQDSTMASFGSGEERRLQLAALHTKSIYDVMWSAADVMTVKQLEIWHDPKGRFMTSDSPVLVPFVDGNMPDLRNARRIWWVISPKCAVSLTDDVKGTKAVISKAGNRIIEEVRSATVQGRERLIITPESQFRHLPVGKALRRRAQKHLTCSQYHDGEYTAPPSCTVRCGDWYGDGPYVSLCSSGLHNPAPNMNLHI